MARYGTFLLMADEKLFLCTRPVHSQLAVCPGTPEVRGRNRSCLYRNKQHGEMLLKAPPW